MSKRKPQMKELTYPFDAEQLLKKKKSLKRKLLEQLDGQPCITKKIAILGGSTTNDIKLMLELFLLQEGIRPSFYESEYNRFYEDAVFGNEELDSFAPDFVIIHTTNRNILQFPKVSDSPEEITRKLEEEYMRFQRVWESLSQKFHCMIIQNNFEYPFYRLMGNLEQSDQHGRVNYILRLNEKFNAYAREHEQFWIHDIHYLSASYGLEKWADPFYWYMYKYAMATEAIPVFAYSLSRIIKSILGKNKKAMAIDLDNTLWGGVVGDDGPENLQLGEETAEGEAYLEFQRYLKQQKQIGVILNVNSKNERDNALAGLAHEAGVLKADDFITIKANWNPKDRNLFETAQELSLLPESFVFVDDNPAEREIVSGSFPGVGVPALTSVEHYIQAIDRAGYFEVTSLSADDLRRNQMYEENASRNKLLDSCKDYDEYLRSLEMRGTIGAFEPVYMARISQLTNKSNQFNLTTKRLTQAEIEQMAASREYITLYGKLADKFGDNGVVSVVIGQKKGTRLDIILWLMSCRVLKRNMEQAMLDTLVEKARAEGITEIHGFYYRTAKNAMVSDFYEQMGFARISPKEQEDEKEYILTDLSSYKKQNHVIKVQ